MTDELVSQTAQAVLGQALITKRVSTATAAMIQALWSEVDPYDGKQVSAFATQAGQLIINSQKTVATAAAASQQLQLRAQGLTNVGFPVTIPDNVRGSSVTFGTRSP